MGTRKGVDARMDLKAITDDEGPQAYFESTRPSSTLQSKDQQNDPSSPPKEARASPQPASSPSPSPSSVTTTAVQNLSISTPAQVPSPTEDQQTDEPPKCTLSYCCICKLGLPASFQTPPTWSEVCRVAMFALERGHKDRKYFHIRREICPFIDAHYDILVPKSKSMSWKQTVNMTLSHPQYAHIFMQESQDHEYGRRKGYYSLRQNIDLYAIPDQGRRTRARKRPDEQATSRKRRKSGGENGGEDGSVDEGSREKQNLERSDPANPAKRDKDRDDKDESGEDRPSSPEPGGDVEGDKLQTKDRIRNLEYNLFMYFLREGNANNSEEEGSPKKVNNSDKEKNVAATTATTTTTKPEALPSNSPRLPSIITAPLSPPSSPSPTSSTTSSSLLTTTTTTTTTTTSTSEKEPSASSSTIKSPSSTTKDTNSTPHSPTPTLPPSLPSLSKAIPSIASLLPNPKTASGFGLNIKSPISVNHLINDEPEQTPLFPNWKTDDAINWNVKPSWAPKSLSNSGDSPRPPSPNRSPARSSPSSFHFSPPQSKPPAFNTLNHPEDSDYPPHPQTASQFPHNKMATPGKAPPSPVLNKSPHFSQIPNSLRSLPASPLMKQSQSSHSWGGYDIPHTPSSQPPFSPFQGQHFSSPFSPPQFSHHPPQHSPYPPPPPHHYPPSQYQKPPPPEYPSMHHSVHQYPPAPSQPIQIHQSPLQNKQPPSPQRSHSPSKHPSPSSSASATTSSPSPSSVTNSPTTTHVQPQQPQRRGRLTTRPWERAILEDYYLSYFCQSRHSRREKVKVDELVKKLGWEISRIQRWLDNRRTKDRPRFGHPEYYSSDNEDEQSSKKPKLSSPSKTGRKSSDEMDDDEDDDSLSPSPSPSPSLSPSITSPSLKQNNNSSTSPPNPNQSNSEFWVIKNK